MYKFNIVYNFVCCFVYVFCCSYECYKLCNFQKKCDVYYFVLYFVIYKFEEFKIYFQEEFFMMYKKGFGNLIGNDCFEGYCVDLIQELFIILDFKYELYFVYDNWFGVR